MLQPEGGARFIRKKKKKKRTYRGKEVSIRSLMEGREEKKRASNSSRERSSAPASRKNGVRVPRCSLENRSQERKEKKQIHIPEKRGFTFAQESYASATSS